LVQVNLAIPTASATPYPPVEYAFESLPSNWYEVAATAESEQTPPQGASFLLAYQLPSSSTSPVVLTTGAGSTYYSWQEQSFYGVPTWLDTLQAAASAGEDSGLSATSYPQGSVITNPFPWLPGLEVFFTGTTYTGTDNTFSTPIWSYGSPVLIGQTSGVEYPDAMAYQYFPTTPPNLGPIVWPMSIGTYAFGRAGNFAVGLSCGASTPTPTPTATPTATATASATATVAPTATATPTATPSPAPTPYCPPHGGPAYYTPSANQCFG
jgi:hypothetical protein